MLVSLCIHILINISIKVGMYAREQQNRTLKRHIKVFQILKLISGIPWMNHNDLIYLFQVLSQRFSWILLQEIITTIEHTRLSSNFMSIHVPGWLCWDNMIHDTWNMKFCPVLKQGSVIKDLNCTQNNHLL